jgi:hypothetical protein
MLDRIHKIAEIVAAFAIVMSLVFVGIQLQQNTAAMGVENRQSAMNAWINVGLAVATNESLSDKLDKGSYPVYRQVDSKRQVLNWVSTQLNITEHQYLQFLDGNLSEETWKGFKEALHLNFRGSQLYNEYWRFGRQYHSSRFQSLVDELIPVETENRRRDIENMEFEEAE